MTAPSTGGLPDTPISPLDRSRIEDILLSEGIDFRAADDVPNISPDIVQTGFPNAAVTFTLTKERLVCDALWRGQPSVTDAHEVIEVVGRLNRTRPVPTVSFSERHSKTLAITAFTSLLLTDGLSRNQLGAFMLGSLEAIMSAFSELETVFPAAVTWRYQP